MLNLSQNEKKKKYFNKCQLKLFQKKVESATNSTELSGEIRIAK